MEDKNVRDQSVPFGTNGGAMQPVGQAPTPLFANVSRATPTAERRVAPLPASSIATMSSPTTPLPSAPPPNTAPPKKPGDWRKRILIISFASLAVLFIGAGILIFQAVSNRGREVAQVTSQIATTSIPLDEFASSGSFALLGTQSLAVNGQLRANESFVLAPQAQPTSSERGQLYFDSTTNRLAYFNGDQFVQIPGDEASVLTLQGQSGDITLVGGSGLVVDGTTLTNTGVTSLGGATGDITLGSGVTIVDGALTTSGLASATGGTGISVINDGAGNITISNVGAGSGTVTSPNGTAGRIAKFTGVQTIEDSLLSEVGSAVTVNGDLNITGTIGLSTALGVNSGGTGATSLAANGVIIGNGTGALTAVTGSIGECLMATAGAPTFSTCPGGGGVTSLNSLTGALTIANATTGGSTITINDATTGAKGIASFNSTNFTVTSGAVNTVQSIAVVATPTFGALTLTSSQATSPMLLVNNTNGSGTGNLIDLQVGGVSRMAVTPAGNMTLTGTLNGQTISSSAAFSGTLAVTGATTLNGGASVTGTLAANTITPSGAMTVGATGQSLTLQGNASTTVSATNSGNTSTLSFQTPTANVTYRLLTAAAGTYDICTTAANCAGVGGGVTTAGGTTNSLPKFTGAQTLGDSIITDNGTTVTIGGVLAVNTITPTGALAIGSTGQALTLQGSTTSLSATNGGVTNSLTFATPSSSNKTITVPNASGTVAVSASGPLALDSNGNLTCATCAISGSGVTSLNGLTGALSLAYASGAGNTVTIQDATTGQKGVAQFNSTNFSVTSGTVNTIQDIAIASAPTFGRLTVTSSQASSAMFLINNTNAGASGNLLDVQLNGSSRLAVTAAGNMTLTGTLNGQTISSAANLTGTLAVAGTASLNGGASVTGTLNANTITPTGTLTVGATTQSFLVQGNASSTITATNGANTTTVAFQTPTANVTYRLLTAAAGTYDVCTTVGNCAGVGGGVTTAGGTTNTVAKFTASGAIGDSLITDNGTTVTIGGTLAVNTITPAAAMTIGATSQDLTLQGAVTSITATSGGVTNTLTFATPGSGNKTITIPNATGTVAVSATGPLSVDSNGNITCATCVTSGGGGGGVGAVDSLNGLTGALTIANATTGGSTITINDASTSQKGIAQFNGTNFSASGGVINTIQNINTTAAPSFGQLTLTSSQASAAMIVVNNTNLSASGNLLDLQQNGVSRLSVTPAGAMTVASTINGQTISSAASFSGTLAVTGVASLNGGANVTGTLGVNTITPSSSLTVGATGQSFLVQGNASSTITATNSGSTTTLAFQTPTANVTYRFLTATAGSYDVCTTAGNCASGGVTTAGGTTGTIAKFTASGAIGDSIMTESGAVISVAGTVAATTAVQAPLLDTASAAALNIGTTNATSINLNKATAITGGLTQSGGVVSITANGASSISTSSGALTLTSAGAATWSTGSGDLTLQSTNTGNTVVIGSSNITLNTAGTIELQDATNINGALTVNSGTGTFNGTLAANGNATLGSDATDLVTISGVLQGGSPFVFEGATADAFETTFAITDPTVDRTITLPNEDGTICTTGSVCTGYAPTSGSANYIRNATSQQTANMNIISAATGSVTAHLEGAAGQSTHVLLVKGGSSQTGDVFEVQTTGSTELFAVDTTGTRVGGTFGVTSGTTTLGGNLLANANINLGDAATDLITMTGVIQGSSPFVFEGATADAFETTFAITDPTVDRTITFSNESGTVCLQASTACGFVTANGPTTFTNTSDSDAAFQIQNSSSQSLLRVDTTNFNTAATNVITNGHFETNTTGWAIKDGASGLTRSTSGPRTGRGALFVSNNAINEGVKFNVTLGDAIYYTGSFYIKLGTGDATAAAGTFVAGYSSNGSTDNTPCNQTSPVVSTDGWVRIVCSFVTPVSHSGTPYFYIKQTDAATRDVLIDDVFLRVDDYSSSADASNGAINLQGIVASPLILQSSSNNTNAFQILNSVGNSVFNVGNNDPSNIVKNSSMETGTLGWSGFGGSLVDFDAEESLFGERSLKVETVNVANNGAEYELPSSDQSLALATSTTYSLSWYAKLSSGTFTDIKARYTRNGGTNFVECTPTAQTVSTTAWTRFSCTFTTDATSPTTDAMLRIVQTGSGTARTFWIDGVRLERGGVASSYGNGTISLDAIVTSPLTIRNKTDSTEAISVQNAAGTGLFNVDATNSRVHIGNVTSDTTGTLLVLDTKSSSGDPTGANGGMYYNSNSGKFRCYEGGAWKNCLGFNANLVVFGANGNGASSQWTNMPAALTEVFGADVPSPASRLLFDLTDATQIRFQVNVASVGSASAELRIQYSTDQATWNYLDSGNTGLGQNVSTTGLKTSSWSTIASGAKGDVYLRVIGINGDATADPRFGLIQVQAR